MSIPDIITWNPCPVVSNVQLTGLISQEIVEWYMAIRKAKLDLLGYNESGISHEKVTKDLIS